MGLPHGIAGIRCDERYAVQPKHGVGITYTQAIAAARDLVEGQA